MPVDLPPITHYDQPALVRVARSNSPASENPLRDDCGAKGCIGEQRKGQRENATPPPAGSSVPSPSSGVLGSSMNFHRKDVILGSLPPFERPESAQSSSRNPSSSSSTVKAIPRSELLAGAKREVVRAAREIRSRLETILLIAKNDKAIFGNVVEILGGDYVPIENYRRDMEKIMWDITGIDEDTLAQVSDILGPDFIFEDVSVIVRAIIDSIAERENMVDELQNISLPFSLYVDEVFPVSARVRRSFVKALRGVVLDIDARRSELTTEIEKLTETLHEGSISTRNYDRKVSELEAKKAELDAEEIKSKKFLDGEIDERKFLDVPDKRQEEGRNRHEMAKEIKLLSDLIKCARGLGGADEISVFAHKLMDLGILEEEEWDVLDKNKRRIKSVLLQKLEKRRKSLLLTMSKKRNLQDRASVKNFEVDDEGADFINNFRERNVANFLESVNFVRLRETKVTEVPVEIVEGRTFKIDGCGTFQFLSDRGGIGVGRSTIIEDVGTGRQRVTPIVGGISITTRWLLRSTYELAGGICNVRFVDGSNIYFDFPLSLACKDIRTGEEYLHFAAGQQ